MAKSTIIRTDAETARYLAELADASGVSRPTFIRLLAKEHGEDVKRGLQVPKMEESS